MSGARYAEWKGWNSESFGTCSAADEVYFAAELRRAGVEAVDGSYILELGFGNGTFAAWALKQGDRKSVV